MPQKYPVAIKTIDTTNHIVFWTISSIALTYFINIQNPDTNRYPANWLSGVFPKCACFYNSLFDHRIQLFWKVLNDFLIKRFDMFNSSATLPIHSQCFLNLHLNGVEFHLLSLCPCGGNILSQKPLLLVIDSNCNSLD